MINLDELYFNDLHLASSELKSLLSDNSVGLQLLDDDTYLTLIHLNGIAKGINLFLIAKTMNRKEFKAFLAKNDMSIELYDEYVDMVSEFFAVMRPDVKMSLLRISDLMRSSIDSTSLTSADILAFNKLPLADFKAFISASNEVKH
ncbi:MAG: hypothetical protein JKY26_01510 [Pseudomonas sp.]|nr:hypothetical protein [Pseudomonas sp.]